MKNENRMKMRLWETLLTVVAINALGSHAQADEYILKGATGEVYASAFGAIRKTGLSNLMKLLEKPYAEIQAEAFEERAAKDFNGCVSEAPFFQSPNAKVLQWAACENEGSQQESNLLVGTLHDHILEDLTQSVNLTVKGNDVCSTTGVHWLSVASIGPYLGGVARCMPSRDLRVWWTNGTHTPVTMDLGEVEEYANVTMASTPDSVRAYLYKQADNLRVRVLDLNRKVWSSNWTDVAEIPDAPANGTRQLGPIIAYPRPSISLHYAMVHNGTGFTMVVVDPAKLSRSLVDQRLFIPQPSNFSHGFSILNDNTKHVLRMAAFNGSNTWVTMKPIAVALGGASPSVLKRFEELTEYDLKEPMKGEPLNNATTAGELGPGALVMKAIMSSNLNRTIANVTHIAPAGDTKFFVKDTFNGGVAQLEVDEMTGMFQVAEFLKHPVDLTRAAGNMPMKFSEVFPDAVYGIQPEITVEDYCQIEKPFFTTYDPGMMKLHAVVHTELQACTIGVIINVPHVDADKPNDQWPATAAIAPAVTVKQAEVCGADGKVLTWGDIMLAFKDNFVAGVVKCEGNEDWVLWAKPVGPDGRINIYRRPLRKDLSRVDSIRLSPSPLRGDMNSGVVTISNHGSDWGEALYFTIQSGVEGRCVIQPRSFIRVETVGKNTCPLHTIPHFVMGATDGMLMGICKNPTTQLIDWVQLEIFAGRVGYLKRRCTTKRTKDLRLQPNQVITFDGRSYLATVINKLRYEVIDFSDGIVQATRYARMIKKLLAPALSDHGIIGSSQTRTSIPKRVMAVSEYEFLWADQRRGVYWQEYYDATFKTLITETARSSFSELFDVRPVGQHRRLIYSLIPYCTTRFALYQDVLRLISVNQNEVFSDFNMTSGEFQHRQPAMTIGLNRGLQQTGTNLFSAEDIGRGYPFDVVTSSTGRITAWTIPESYAVYMFDTEQPMVLYKVTLEFKPTGLRIDDRLQDFAFLYISLEEHKQYGVMKIICELKETQPFQHPAFQLLQSPMRHFVDIWSKGPPESLGDWPTMCSTDVRDSRTIRCIEFQEKAHLITMRSLQKARNVVEVRALLKIDGIILDENNDIETTTPLVLAVIEGDDIRATQHLHRYNIIWIFSLDPKIPFTKSIQLPILVDSIQLTQFSAIWLSAPPKQQEAEDKKNNSTAAQKSQASPGKPRKAQERRRKNRSRNS